VREVSTNGWVDTYWSINFMSVTQANRIDSRYASSQTKFPKGISCFDICVSFDGTTTECRPREDHQSILVRERDICATHAALILEVDSIEKECSTEGISKIPVLILTKQVMSNIRRLQVLHRFLIGTNLREIPRFRSIPK
jgi:hypothetical protein